jgi:hypothetical protein
MTPAPRSKPSNRMYVVSMRATRINHNVCIFLASPF